MGCHYTVDIRTGGVEVGRSSKVEYIIHGSRFQCYFYCNICPCAHCQRVEFDIHEGSGLGNKVGILARTGRDCCRNFWLGNDADEFTVDFPPNADWKQRAMLMNAVVFIDYSMFEDTSENK